MINNVFVNIILLNANLLSAGLLLLFLCQKLRPSGAGEKTVHFTEAVIGLLEFAVYGAGMVRMADLILQGIAFPGRADGALLAVRVLLTESMLLLFPLWKLLYRWKKAESCPGAGAEQGSRETYVEYGSRGLHRQNYENMENGRGHGRIYSGWGDGPGYGGRNGKKGGGSVRYSILREGEYFLGLLLLLWLTLQGWREQELLRAFGRQAWVLLLFFCYGYLKIRRQQWEYACFHWNMGNSGQGDGRGDYGQGEGCGTGDRAGREVRAHGTESTSLRSDRHLGIRVGQESCGIGSDAGYTMFQGFSGDIRQAYRTEYLRNVEQQYQRTRELWHDLKNHIKVLEILAEEGRFDELTDYLDSFRQDVERRMVPARTGCAPVDALLGDKLYQAGRMGVEMKMELCQLSQTGIESVDLCVILGNLLDNALEACTGLSGERHIEVRIRREEEFYYITVINTAEEPVQMGEGYFSAKHGRENVVGHGLGLRSVQRAAHRYGGLLATDYGDGKFKAVVRLQGSRNALIRTAP